MRVSLGIATAALAVGLATAAQGQGKGQTRDDTPGQTLSVTSPPQAPPRPMPAPTPFGSAGTPVSIGANDQIAIRQFYRQQAAQGFCPPGLAKKNNGCMPPAQERKWAIGSSLPGGIAYNPVPAALVRRLSFVPPAYRYVQVGPDVLLMGVATRMIAGAVTIF